MLCGNVGGGEGRCGACSGGAPCSSADWGGGRGAAGSASGMFVDAGVGWLLMVASPVPTAAVGSIRVCGGWASITAREGM